MIGSGTTMITQGTTSRRGERSEVGNLLVQLMDGVTSIDFDQGERGPTIEGTAAWSKINTVIVQLSVFDDTGIQRRCRELSVALHGLVFVTRESYGPGGDRTLRLEIDMAREKIYGANFALQKAMQQYLARRWWRPRRSM